MGLTKPSLVSVVLMVVRIFVLAEGKAFVSGGVMEAERGGRRRKNKKKKKKEIKRRRERYNRRREWMGRSE